MKITTTTVVTLNAEQINKIITDHVKNVLGASGDIRWTLESKDAGASIDDIADGVTAVVTINGAVSVPATVTKKSKKTAKEEA